MPYFIVKLDQQTPQYLSKNVDILEDIKEDLFITGNSASASEVINKGLIFDTITEAKQYIEYLKEEYGDAPEHQNLHVYDADVLVRSLNKAEEGYEDERLLLNQQQEREMLRDGFYDHLTPEEIRNM